MNIIEFKPAQATKAKPAKTLAPNALFAPYSEDDISRIYSHLGKCINHFQMRGLDLTLILNCLISIHNLFKPVPHELNNTDRLKDILTSIIQHVKEHAYSIDIYPALELEIFNLYHLALAIYP